MPSDAAHRHVIHRIRDLMRRRGWSQNQLADFADLSRAQMSRILSGAQSPTLTTLVKIAAALEVKVGELVV